MKRISKLDETTVGQLAVGDISDMIVLYRL